MTRGVERSNVPDNFPYLVKVVVPTGAWTHLGNTCTNLMCVTVSQNDNCGTELPPATFCTGDVQNLHTRNFSSLSLAASQ
jgi:hypothetical protein